MFYESPNHHVLKLVTYVELWNQITHRAELWLVHVHEVIGLRSWSMLHILISCSSIDQEGGIIISKE